MQRQESRPEERFHLTDAQAGKLADAIVNSRKCPLDFPTGCRYVNPGRLGEWAEESLGKKPKGESYKDVISNIARCAPCGEEFNILRSDLSQELGEI